MIKKDIENNWTDESELWMFIVIMKSMAKVSGEALAWM